MSVKFRKLLIKLSWVTNWDKVGFNGWYWTILGIHPPTLLLLTLTFPNYSRSICRAFCMVDVTFFCSIAYKLIRPYISTSFVFILIAALLKHIMSRLSLFCVNIYVSFFRTVNGWDFITSRRQCTTPQSPLDSTEASSTISTSSLTLYVNDVL